MRPAANSTASSVNLSAELASYPQISQTRRHGRGLGFESPRAYHYFQGPISYLCFVFSLRNCAPRFGSDALTVLSKEDANTFDKVIATNLRGIFWHLDRRPCCRRQSRKISTSIF